MAGKKGKKRVARQGIKVTAVSTSSGPPSTTVHVELDREELKREVGEFDAVKRVEADIPQRSGGGVRWEHERMSGMASAPAGSRRENIERYFGVHYGPTEAKRLGVGVTIETDAGTVRGQSKRESYTVGEPDRPCESARKPKPE
jgi:hypothetical protein